MKKELLHISVSYDLVDRNDRFVRIGTKADAKRLGLWQRLAHIFIFNVKGELLICRRPKTTRAYPGVWTSSAGGHIEQGESYRAGAARELYEELGLRLALHEVGLFETITPLHGRKLTRLFATRVFDVRRLRPNPNEIDLWKFVPMQKLTEAVFSSPRKFAYPFRKAFMFFLKKKSSVTQP